MAYDSGNPDGSEAILNDREQPANLRAFRSRRVVTPEGLRPATIVSDSGRIVSISAWDNFPASADALDFGDMVLLPGLIDSHVHMNEADEADSEVSRKDWEGFYTATRAAAAGGITTLVDMPLNCVPETISVAALEAKRAAALGLPDTHLESSVRRGSQTFVDWMTWGGVVGNGGQGGNESEMPALIAAGVPGFKCFLVNSGIDTFAWTDEAQLRKAMSVLAAPEHRHLNLPLLAHAELAGPIVRATERLYANDADWRSYSTYLASRPDTSETEAIALLLRVAQDYNLAVHVVHLTTALALPMIREAREAGLKITVETCPHYLWFCAEEIPDGGTEYKCAPPIRDHKNRESLWEALLGGEIDFVASDHSPCPPGLKGKDQGRFDQAWGGIASLGLALPILWTGLGRRLNQAEESMRQAGPFELLARWLSTEPARLAGLTGQKGSLAPGFDCDIAVFDPDAEWTVTEHDFHFRHKLSPYLGATLRGRVVATYLRGEPICSIADDSTSNIAPKGRELSRATSGQVC